MKTMRSLFITGAIIMITMLINEAQVQGQIPGHKSHPNAKWKVRKEYDEKGNLIYYDSSYIQAWKDFEFPGPVEGHAFEDIDSLFGDFFNSSEDLFEHHSFSFEPYGDFMDSLDLDFYLDSSIFQGPQGFIPFAEFPDVFFDNHKEWIERFRERFSFPEDSINQLHPKWQQLPNRQKKPARVIEI